MIIDESNDIKVIHLQENNLEEIHSISLNEPSIVDIGDF